MINVLFNSSLADPWLTLAESVPELNTVYWIAMRADPDIELLKERLSGKAYIQYWDDAWHGNGYPADLELETPDQLMLEKYASFELQALQMMSRLDPDGLTFSLAERRRFFRYLLSAAKALVKKYDVNLVLSPSIPHRIHDYVLYAVCKTEGIPFIMFQYVPFPSRSFIIEEIDRIPKVISDFRLSAGDQTVELHPDISKKMDELTKASGYIPPLYMVKQRQEMAKRKGINGAIAHLREIAKRLLLKSRKPVKTKLKNRSIRTQYVSKFSNARIYVKKELALLRLHKNYHRWVSERPMRERPYVLVALHYQPEETTAPSGGTYADQTLVVDMLHTALDPGIDIVVKEHKSQFNNFSPWKGERGRLSEDYAHMARTADRVRFVSEHEDPFKLINNALAVATVTGTIGYESALQGTPALYFGRAWYQGMPRAYQVTSAKALKADWPGIISQRSTDLSEAILAWHKNLQRFLIYASQYRMTGRKALVTKEESAENLISGLAAYGENSENQRVREALLPFKIRLDMEIDKI